MQDIQLILLGLHVVAALVALGMIAKCDFGIIKSLLTGRRGPTHDARILRGMQRSIRAALQILWLSGLALLALQVRAQGYEVLLASAMQLKLGVAILLTVNGSLMRMAVLPALMRAGSLLRLSLSRCVLSVAAGSVASVSFWFAALLGMASLLQWPLPAAHCLASFAVSLLASLTGMLLIVAWAQARDASIWRGERVAA